MGPAVLQNDLVVGNLGNRLGAVSLVATEGSISNVTMADNRAIAIAAVGGAVAIPAQVTKRGQGCEIEGTSASLEAVLLCARHLPVYLVQDAGARRILDTTPAQVDGTFRLELESSEGVVAGPCQVATEAHQPVVLSRSGRGWHVRPDRLPLSPPVPGQQIMQGTVEGVISAVAGESPPYLVVLEEDTPGLDEGAAVLAAPPVPGASLRIINSIVWGGEEIVRVAGEAKIEIRYSDLADKSWAGEANINADPRFVAPPDDYRLAPGSPAIDAGTSVGAPRVDFEGTVRPLDGDGDGRAAWDLGAYEAQPPPP
ncbi:hypothetical protein AMJ85_07055 [candidate division BRC1 bacterium SM23_51]|nr:MAG: hypothetical protein AMJ85_07055 [candidate division BRC1 bacterium SM23_51]